MSYNKTTPETQREPPGLYHGIGSLFYIKAEWLKYYHWVYFERNLKD
jgi:hypothetical protein